MGVHVCEWMCERKEESKEKKERLSEGVCVRESKLFGRSFLRGEAEDVIVVIVK